jgi:hypothetical protein
MANINLHHRNDVIFAHAALAITASMQARAMENGTVLLFTMPMLQNPALYAGRS